MTLFDADAEEAIDNHQPGQSSRLDAIYAQLKELEAFKDDIMDDLDDFMSEVDKSKIVKLPDNFEEVVDLVVAEKRDQADDVGHAMDKGNKEELQLAL